MKLLFVANYCRSVAWSRRNYRRILFNTLSLSHFIPCEQSPLFLHPSLSFPLFLSFFILFSSFLKPTTIYHVLPSQGTIDLVTYIYWDKQIAFKTNLQSIFSAFSLDHDVQHLDNHEEDSTQETPVEILLRMHHHQRHWYENMKTERYSSDERVKKR